MKIILTIAGSDPSGGAGIQADLKTINSLGCYGAAAITSITCQNTTGVSSFYPLPSELVGQQITDVLADLAVTHIKIGMTGSTEICLAVQQAIKDFPGPIILDPVQKSSTGNKLAVTNNSSVLKPLLETCTILTPNTEELALLSGLPCYNYHQVRLAADKILETYQQLKGICLKGGHLNENNMEIIDYYLDREAVVPGSPHPRITTNNSHGTGCTFASALACYHAINHNFPKAFQETVKYMATLVEISKKQVIGHGTGPLAHHLIIGHHHCSLIKP